MNIFKVNVPDSKGNTIWYPGNGQSLYTKQEAVKVMESFGRKSIRRITPGDKLEVWASGPGCNFTLADYNEDFNGVRTENV
jgi:hypothetical protein